MRSAAALRVCAGAGLTPRKPDLGYSLRVVDEYVRAADLFVELREIGREADARYSASHVLSTAALVHPEHRERALTVLMESEKLFRQVANWHGVGICLFGEAELLDRWYEDVEREDDRIERLMAEMVEVFRRAERPIEEAVAIRRALVTVAVQEAVWLRPELVDADDVSRQHLAALWTPCSNPCTPASASPTSAARLTTTAA